MNLPNYHEISHILHGQQLGLSAAELHGSLTGFLSANGQTDANDWLVDLSLQEVANGLAGAADRNILEELYVATVAQLNDPNMSFELLLPDDETGLELRAQELVNWCRGFLSGVGLSGNLFIHSNAEAKELLEDIGRVAATHIQTDEQNNEDEEAYMEVSEYVRMGAIYMMDLCHSNTSDTVH